MAAMGTRGVFAGLAAALTRARPPVEVAGVEAEAFDVLTDRALDDAYRLASVVLRDPIEAEDVVQDAVIQAQRRFDGLRDVGRFDAWFGRIVLNLCRDRLRSRRRSQVRDLALAAEMERRGGGDPLGAVVRRDALAAAFPRLDPDLQLVVALRFYRDLPLERIAELLDVPLGTVKSRLHTALKRLRAELERQGWTEEAER